MIDVSVNQMRGILSKGTSTNATGSTSKMPLEPDHFPPHAWLSAQARHPYLWSGPPSQLLIIFPDSSFSLLLSFSSSTPVVFWKCKENCIFLVLKNPLFWSKFLPKPERPYIFQLLLTSPSLPPTGIPIHVLHCTYHYLKLSFSFYSADFYWAPKI